MCTIAQVALRDGRRRVCWDGMARGGRERLGRGERRDGTGSRAKASTCFAWKLQVEQEEWPVGT